MQDWASESCERELALMQAKVVILHCIWVDGTTFEWEQMKTA
jgi:hypothetical protein